MANIAIYARKSVYREDSISIESQIELCSYETRGEEYRVYSDNGFSGKNTERPAFKQMMDDIRDMKVTKVIVYKLDRISRSLLDFAEMMDVFRKNNVDFVSATEHFDTSTPMGRAMLNICIVFAQLERETIQQRVADAYASRSKRGFYMGGKIPFGYDRTKTVIDGINTSMYIPEPNESEILRMIYDMYSVPSATLGDVLRKLNELDLLRSKRGYSWNTARLTDTMRNPAYTSNSYEVYRFYKERGADLVNDVSEYDGKHSLYLFSGSCKNRKSWDLKDTSLVIAPHKGLIPPETWITCRKKLLENHQVRSVKAKNSFLTGKVKCAYCGKGFVIRKSNTKAGRYFIDLGRDNYVCKVKHDTIYADDFEQRILEVIGKKLDTLNISKPQKKQEIQNERLKDIRSETEVIEEAIANLVIKLEMADAVTMKYINSRISEYDARKRELIKELEHLSAFTDKSENKDTRITNAIKLWDKLSFEEKRNVIELLITKIVVHKDKIEIIWKI